MSEVTPGSIADSKILRGELKSSLAREKNHVEEKKQLRYEGDIYKTRLELFIRTLFPDIGEINIDNINQLTNNTLNLIKEYQNARK